MHEICKCTCRLDASVSNNQQRWNEDNAGGNVKNWLIKEVVIIDLLGILVVLNVNVINHINVNVMLENIWTNKTSAEKN